MHETIKVHVVKYPDRENLMMRYRCPDSGKQVARSSGTANEKAATKAAAVWEEQLREGRYQRSSRMPWDEFREQYENATVEGQKLATVRNYASTLNAFEAHCRPARVLDLNTGRVTAFIAALRKERQRRDDTGEVTTYRISEASVARHLRHLKAVSRWANRQGLLPTVPTFDMPKRSQTAKMKGRPICLEEFEKMLAATAGVVGADAAESWQLLLWGLWTTGLRLGEAMALRWDHQPGGVSVELSGMESVLAFDADAQKSGRTQHVPLAPEAVELLEPIRRARGYVFSPRTKLGAVMARDHQRAGKIIAKIGAAAGVVTDPAKGQTATAHDLRRSFASRWSKRVMPAVLKEIMRHADIQTTMSYYATQSARTTAAELWAVAATQYHPEGQRPQTHFPVGRQAHSLD